MVEALSLNGSIVCWGVLARAGLCRQASRKNLLEHRLAKAGGWAFRRSRALL